MISKLHTIYDNHPLTYIIEFLSKGFVLEKEFGSDESSVDNETLSRADGIDIYNHQKCQ